MKPRSPWQGMLTIARFNWPFYVAAALVFVASVSVLAVPIGALQKVVAVLAVAATLYFLIGSLGVSHLIYDRSDLYRWRWLERALQGVHLDRAIFCHSGFDEASEALRSHLPDVEWVVLDHFDDKRMTEPSIRRARRLFPPTPRTLPARFDRWPVATASADAVFGILAVHELRSDAERTAWFAECRRCLRTGGRVVLVEHMRDPANFLAFGPGFLHFHSPSSWRRSWEAAGLRAMDEFRVTPWVRVFVITPE